MPKALAFCVVVSLLAGAPLLRSQDDSAVQPFSPEELDNLLAPIALYPDPLLAQVLPAATFPDQIDEAARFSRAGDNPDSIDVQPWDVSIKAVAHYSSVLYMMADRLDWTTALGQAYVNQTDDVMASIQRLRQEARNVGNLDSTPEEEVVVDGNNIDIWPAQPDYCYVPVYDPALVFFGSGGVFGGAVVTFSAPAPIGVWLVYNFDWRHHRIYYHGWSEGGGWVRRSRPYIHVSNVYVNRNNADVSVNRGVISRPVNRSVLAGDSGIDRNVAREVRRAHPAADHPGDANRVIQRVPPVRTQRETGFGSGAASHGGQSSRAEAPHPAPSPVPSGGGGGSHGSGGGGGASSHNSGDGRHH